MQSPNTLHFNISPLRIKFELTKHPTVFKLEGLDDVGLARGALYGLRRGC